LVLLLPDPVTRVVPDDSDDDVIVATAVAGKADFLCTRNRHLFNTSVTDYCSQRRLQVIDDLQLLAMLRHSSPDWSA
jgi:predicted nucleic acid-binding protein